MIKEIKISCIGAATLELEQIEPFQGSLKELSKENYDKLRKQIIELGFSEPCSVWKTPEGRYKAINCHQRLRVLTEMKRSEGFKIPRLPVSFIEAESEFEAKKKVLALTSQFGEITNESLFEFASIANIDLDTLKNFRFPELDMKKFEQSFFEDPPEEKPKKTKTCPECGHEF